MEEPHGSPLSFTSVNVIHENMQSPDDDACLGEDNEAQLPIASPVAKAISGVQHRCATGTVCATLASKLWYRRHLKDSTSDRVSVWTTHALAQCLRSKFESNNYPMLATAADDTDDADPCAAGFQQRFGHRVYGRGQSDGGAAGRVCAATAGQASALAALARQLHCQRGMCDIHKVVTWCTVCWVAKVSLECMQLQKRMVGRRSSSRFSAQHLPLWQSWHRGEIEMQCC